MTALNSNMYKFEVVIMMSRATHHRPVTLNFQPIASYIVSHVNVIFTITIMLLTIQHSGIIPISCINTVT